MAHQVYMKFHLCSKGKKLLFQFQKKKQLLILLIFVGKNCKEILIKRNKQTKKKPDPFKTHISKLLVFDAFF